MQIILFGVYMQMNLILHQDLRFRKDQVVVVDLPYTKRSTFETDRASFLHDISTFPGVGDYPISSSVAGDNDPHGVVLRKAAKANPVDALRYE
jgi:hypothetical protein